MSLKAQYFFWKLLALIAAVFAIYCFGTVSPWAVYGFLAVIVFKALDEIGEVCWRLHKNIESLSGDERSAK